ncbi:MAG TPA: HAD family hydrolase [Polyangiaceae bacterium]|jgi:hypothetical protein|nr:HAD family hydrolase [Polyangiaceae bacterium]
MRAPVFVLVAFAAVSCGGSTTAMAPALTSATTETPAHVDALHAWNDGAAKRALLDFVARVTKDGGPDFVPPAERIATFDNDGTLWAEKPVPVELAFTLDRVKALAKTHPAWRTQKPFASVLEDNVAELAASGERGFLELVAATHAGMTTDEFARSVNDWIATARDATTGRLYTERVYEPMLEVLAYLRANGFKTFIVSGGGVDFMRAWTERVYGIPPEQVVGSTVRMKLEIRDAKPVIVKLPRIDLIDDKEGKPIGIESRIGRRPIAAFGNSDGDRQMLEWTMAGAGPRFALVVHHDDARREWAYDRDDKLAKLDAAWNEAVAKGWTVVSMKSDWNAIYPARE